MSSVQYTTAIQMKYTPVRKEFRKMKICVISTASLQTPPTDYGGMEIESYLLTKGLEELGHTVTLIAKDGSYIPNGGLSAVENESYIPLSYDTTLRHLGIDAYIDMSHDKRLSHAHPELPIIEQYQVMSMTGIGKNPVLISRGQRDGKFPGLKCEIIYQHIDLSLYKPNYDQHDPYFLTLAQIIEEKRIDWSISVALKAGVPLVVAGPWWGDSRYMNMLRDMANGHPEIILMDSVGGEDKLRLLRNARALLHFPGAKGFCEAGSIVTLESLASGTPVIISDNGVHREYVRNGFNGFVVDSIEDAVGVVVDDRIESIDKRNCRKSVEWADYRRMALEYEGLCARVSSGDTW